MKMIGIALTSFILGAVISGLIGLKLSMGVGYQSIIGKLTDNVMFYRQIERGEPELTKMAIESSLDWFISLAEDGESSMWVSPTENEKQTLVRAKELQLQINKNSETK